MEKTEKLRELKEKMTVDDSLPLRNGAQNLVFGEGSPDAEIMFIGEGPGYWEDMKARPFVGRAGALLNQMLVTIEIPRGEVFITNVVHFRPPSNRDPEPSEIAAFQPYLDRIIEIIEPKIIVTLGRFSMAKFLPGVYISNVHGKERVINWNGRKIIVLPMYHPAAALRSGDIMRKAKEDFLKLTDVLKAASEVIVETEKDKANVEQMKLV